MDRIFKVPMKSHLDLILHRADTFKAVELTLINTNQAMGVCFHPFYLLTAYETIVFCARSKQSLQKHLPLENAMSVSKI